MYKNNVDKLTVCKKIPKSKNEYKKSDSFSVLIAMLKQNGVLP